jgi:hypothetical protein
MPVRDTIPPRIGFHPTLILTEPERDLAAWYFSFLPTAQDTPVPRHDTEAPDRPEVSLTTPQDGPRYIGMRIALSGLAGGVR